MGYPSCLLVIALRWAPYACCSLYPQDWRRWWRECRATSDGSSWTPRSLFTMSWRCRKSYSASMRCSREVMVFLFVMIVARNTSQVGSKSVGVAHVLINCRNMWLSSLVLHPSLISYDSIAYMRSHVMLIA